jgi:predicted alpha/beta-fold hydrolase
MWSLLQYIIGSHESYVRAILAPACAPVSEGGLGYRAVVVNFRGCRCLDLAVDSCDHSYPPGAGTPVTSPQLYSAGYTDDLRQALIYIRKCYPRAPLLGVGFSLGANVLTRYIAEEGEKSQLAAGCALACVSNHLLVIQFSC